MPENDLRDYMLQRTSEIQAEYERIQKRSGDDSGTAGDNGEENWKETFQKWLPPIYRVVTKGRIMNTKGECGPQVDVLVLSPWYPEHLLGKKEYLEGGVIAAFECKLTLRAGDIRDAVENSVSIRRNSYPHRTGTPFKEANHRVIYGLLAHSHAWKGEKSTPIENVENHLRTNEAGEVQHPRELLDVVCVADLATWKTSRMFLAPQVFAAANEQVMNAHRIRYGNFPFQGGVVEAGHIRFSENTQHMPEDQGRITPVGNLLVHLFDRIAYEDEGLRSFAEYFILANISGSGRGDMQTWTLDVFSDELRSRILRGGWGTEGRWNEWGPSL